MPVARSGVIALLCAAVLLGACRAGEPTDTAETPRPLERRQTIPGAAQGAAAGTLRVGASEPQTLVPSEAIDEESLTVIDALFDSLTDWDRDGRAVPSAAQRWSASANARVWTFTLRWGATFHDGTPVTAGDVKFAWERAVNSEAGYHLRDVAGHDALASGEADELTGLEVIDARTLQVRLERPRGDFASVVGHPSLAPLPRRAWAEDAETQRRRPIGNGPFEAGEEWVRGEFLRARPFADWRNGRPPRLDEVLFQFAVPDDAFLAFQQGRLHVAQVPVGALAAARQRHGRSTDGYTGPGVLDGPRPATYFLGVNTEQPPFDDVAVRRALSQAVDRLRIAETFPDGHARPATGLVPPGLGGAEEACPACTHDPEAAASVFEDAGVTELTLWFNRGGGHEPVALALREQLAEVGVRLAFRSAEFEEYLELLSDGVPGLYRFGWQADVPTATSMLRPLLHPAARPDGPEAGHNYGAYADERVAELLDAAQAAQDRERRAELSAAAEALAVGRDQAVVPLVYLRHRTVVADDVEGVALGPTGLLRLTDARLREPPGDGDG